MPFYQFNSSTGRLKKSAYLQPLYPTSTHPLNKKELLEMIWDSIKTKPLRTISPSSMGFSTLNPKMLAKYKKFQVNVEKPVYLMGGSPDKILFTTTCILVVAGVAQCLKLFYDMANPKKL
ncbi:uncharacterized protein LOC131675272 [Phymastichus coffea]|uniref:uncharacterized protein LOC131675272 n=1 Tax=Phymastichus coffea TaxID=108790 RepID=UPI00273B64B1|nr:uncharacterized protein LOC131675272 [Phymastichus coffea]